MTERNKMKTRKFRAEVARVLDIVVNSLYSNRDVFLRELISNAADALDRLRFESISRAELVPAEYRAVIRLIPDVEAGRLTVWDNGVGMSADELEKNLGTIAHSGSEQFLQKLAEAQREKDLTLIGQFGMGFYSAYLVADRVEVISRAAGTEEANLWSSDGKQSFTIEPAERDTAGTSVVLHVGKERESYLSEWKLRELVSRYSDFINHDIELRVERAEKDQPAEQRFEVVNQASALWKKTPKEISDEQYEAFYKPLSHDFEPPFGRVHFSVEGKQAFTGLLFVPKRPRYDLFLPESRHGVRLYVRRVFIMDECEELLPRWLRFVQGVIDSDDLPLNLSRELLQDSQVTRTIRKQIIRRVLDLLAKRSAEEPQAYLEFWAGLGAVLKEGIYFDREYKDKLVPLLRYQTTAQQEPSALGAYIERMPEGQKAIYYAIGSSRELLADSPHLEALKRKGFEVLLMTDMVDQWAVEILGEIDGKKLINAMQADLDLDSDAPEDGAKDKEEEDKSDGETAEPPEALRPFLQRVGEVLGERVSEVRPSRRLTDSPACLVIPRGGLPAAVEQALRAAHRALPESKRILEINLEHELVKSLRLLHAEQPGSEKLARWIELLHDQALLSEGSPLPDPARFARSVTELLQTAARAEAPRQGG